MSSSTTDQQGDSASSRVPLLDDEGELTPKFEDALAYIFQKYSTVPSEAQATVATDATSSATSSPARSPARRAAPLLGSRPPNGSVITDVALDKFAHETNGAPFPQDTKTELKEFLDCDEQGRLTFEGFLGLYHLQSDNDPDETWKDLSTHGFQSDLDLVSTRREGADEEPEASPSAQSDSTPSDHTAPTVQSGATPSAQAALDTASPEKVDYKTRLLTDLHIAHILKLSNSTSSLHYHLSTHLRLNGVYWGLGALELMGRGELLPTADLVDFVMSCYDPESGGFGPFPNHDAHILNTLSAIQILAIKGRLDALDRSKVISYILSLRNPATNLFYGDSSQLEEDSRFLYCAVSALTHLSALDQLDTESAIAGILSCHNFDGGFGRVRGAESHAGQIFVCVGALSILSALDRIDLDRLGAWLSERQIACGGLNGRPQKLEDVCYSWWVLSSLSMIARLHWINAERLKSFILSAQDPDSGGISDRPDNVADVFHTFFGLTGLSLLGYPGLQQVDPVYAMPADVVKSIPGMYRSYQTVEQGLQK